MAFELSRLHGTTVPSAYEPGPAAVSVRVHAEGGELHGTPYAHVACPTVQDALAAREKLNGFVFGPHRLSAAVREPQAPRSAPVAASPLATNGFAGLGLDNKSGIELLVASPLDGPHVDLRSLSSVRGAVMHFCCTACGRSLFSSTNVQTSHGVSPWTGGD